jgi:hypothetical protein
MPANTKSKGGTVQACEQWIRSRTITRSTVVIITALGVMLSTAGPASAALDDEEDTWHAEVENNVRLQSSATISEAYDNNGNLIQAWRSNDANWAIWVSYNHGSPQRWPNAATAAAPRVIWTDYGFRIFHTGIDGNIYYAGLTIVSGGILNLGNWVQVPNSARTIYSEAVSVVALPNGSWYLAWTDANGSSGNDQIWAIYYNGPSATYSAATALPDVRSLSAPSIAYAPAAGRILFVWRGINDLVYVGDQLYGTNTFMIWGYLPTITTDEPPTVAVASNGIGEVVARNRDTGYLMETVISAQGRTWLGSWTEESTRLVTNHAVWLTVIGTAIYMILTDPLGNVFWKRGANLQGY